MKKTLIACAAAILLAATPAFADGDSASEPQFDHHHQEFLDQVFGPEPQGTRVPVRWKKDPCTDDSNWRRFGCSNTNEVDYIQK